MSIKWLVSICCFMCGLLVVPAAAITVESTNFISSPSNFNGFENIPAKPFDWQPFGPPEIYTGGNGPYSEGGITVQYVGTLSFGNIWTGYTPSIGGQGDFGWYPNGGGFGYTKITLSDGKDFQSVQFLTGSGSGSALTTQYELLKDGALVATGITPNSGASAPMGYIGFSGGGFDIILVQALVSNGPAFSPTGFDALAIDSIAAIEAIDTPLPAALPLFATGLGVMGLLARRRKMKTQATA